MSSSERPVVSSNVKDIISQVTNADAGLKLRDKGLSLVSRLLKDLGIKVQASDLRDFRKYAVLGSLNPDMPNQVRASFEAVLTMFKIVIALQDLNQIAPRFIGGEGGEDYVNDSRAAADGRKDCMTLLGAAPQKYSGQKKMIAKIAAAMSKTLVKAVAARPSHLSRDETGAANTLARSITLTLNAAMEDSSRHALMLDYVSMIASESTYRFYFLSKIGRGPNLGFKNGVYTNLCLMCKALSEELGVSDFDIRHQYHHLTILEDVLYGGARIDSFCKKTLMVFATALVGFECLFGYSFEGFEEGFNLRVGCYLAAFVVLAFTLYSKTALSIAVPWFEKMARQRAEVTKQSFAGQKALRVVHVTVDDSLASVPVFVPANGDVERFLAAIREQNAVKTRDGGVKQVSKKEKTKAQPCSTVSVARADIDEATDEDLVFCTNAQYALRLDPDVRSTSKKGALHSPVELHGLFSERLRDAAKPEFHLQSLGRSGFQPFDGKARRSQHDKTKGRFFGNLTDEVVSHPMSGQEFKVVNLRAWSPTGNH